MTMTMTMTMSNIGKFIKKNAPTILTILASAGVVATGVAAAKESSKAQKDLEEHKDDEPIDKAIIFCKDYKWSLGIGAATIACTVGSNVLNQKQQANIISMYMASNEIFKRYRGQVKERYGDEVDEEILSKCIGFDAYFSEEPLDHPDFIALYFEPYTGATIKAYERDMLIAEHHINKNMVLGGEMSVADYARMLGIEESEIENCHEEEGWSTTDGFWWFDVNHVLLDKRDKDTGLPVYMLVTEFCPTKNFRDEYL